MASPNYSIKEFIGVIQRRKKLLFIPPALVTLICAIGAFQITRMYESSIRLLVQRNLVQNPLSNFMMQGTDDPLRGFREIIYSANTIEKLIDSLGLRSNITSELDKRKIMKELAGNITTTNKGDESITIAFMNSDPVKARQGVLALTNLFIETGSSVKDIQNESMVEFYRSKLEEFRQKLDESQAKSLPKLAERFKENTTVGISINSIDQQIRDSEQQLKEYQEELGTIKDFRREDMATDNGKTILYEFQRSEIPFAIELRTILARFSAMSERYTEKHPEVDKIVSQIIDLLERIKGVLGNEINKLNLRLSNLRSQRTKIINEMVRLSSLESKERDKEHDYAFYQKLYAEMKVKLEEAQMTRSISRDADYRFTVLDPAYLPLFPSKPSRILIILAGLGAGLLIGIGLTIASELLDTTIRNPKQIALYQKPIIALLPRGRGKEVE